MNYFYEERLNANKQMHSISLGKQGHLVLAIEVIDLKSSDLKDILFSITIQSLNNNASFIFLKTPME